MVKEKHLFGKEEERRVKSWGTMWKVGTCETKILLCVLYEHLNLQVFCYVMYSTDTYLLFLIEHNDVNIVWYGWM